MRPHASRGGAFARRPATAAAPRPRQAPGAALTNARRQAKTPWIIFLLF